MMRLFAAALALLPVAASSVPPADVSVGKFVDWLSSRKASVQFVSGGVAIAIDPLPCQSEDMTGDSSCNVDHYNNRASVTITAPGAAAFVTTTDRQSEYARVAVVRIDRRDPRPGVVIDSDSGGSGGDSWIDVVVPTATGYHAVALTMRIGARTSRDLQGEVADFPRDKSGDGITDFVLQDPRFDMRFGCNACTPRPPLVLSVVDGHAVDLSADPSVRTVFAADMAKLRPRCFAIGDVDRNGACAAYVADAARAGRFAEGWRDMLAHYDRQPQWNHRRQDCTTLRDVHGANPPAAETSCTTFPASLRAFLAAAGYITATQAAAAPLA